MRTTPFGLLVAAGMVLGIPSPAGLGPSAAHGKPGYVERPQKAIDLAICLDTSGSMSGLIDSARQKLWAIVNDLAEAEPVPRLRVALLTFGNNDHDPENGWVRVDSGFTDDLDLISQRLFALRTNGGTEYVGRTLQFAGQLDWSPSDDALKLVVVAGNESADQDRVVTARVLARELVSRGIMINSIYCGPATDAIAPGWMEVAKLADGQFAVIDQDHGTLVVATPFDEELAGLSAALNETYLPFGARGAEGMANQAAQDANAGSLNGATAAARAKTKTQALYVCAWDLVDACRAGHVALETVAADELPEPMREMTAPERAAYVDAMWARRTEIRSRIGSLSAERDAFVQAEITRRGLDGSKGFDHAVRRAVRDQAMSRGFRFPAGPEKDSETMKDGC